MRKMRHASVRRSYAFAYFRPHRLPQVNQHIFENLQHSLEMHTERLAHLVESKPAKVRSRCVVSTRASLLSARAFALRALRRSSSSTTTCK